ncbi:thioredoxin domain-containing protein 17-like [Sycon ciliatum]|uniref:thioredoxin domain-containing protein 17-like n=1 Tax=Sycon ciliatum TaxID=27933 RepID=UPI0020A88D0F|eukprot:scpid104564/ scgid23824/ Thioredoxin domain-containing protein 17; Thioredoxin-like protein 5
MALTEVHVKGVEDYLSAVETHKAAPQVFGLFCGGTDPATGASWCPDCVTADPVIASELPKVAKAGAVLIHVDVGGRDAWKDKQNAYRTHPQLKLTSVPTLLLHGTPKRLTEEQCAKASHIAMLAEDED